MAKGIKATTPVAMLSYPHLHQPVAGPNGGKPKYSATLVFAPGTDLRELQAAAIAAATEKFGPTWKLPNGTTVPIAQAFAEGILKSPFRKDAVAKGYAEGAVFINVRSDNAPGIVYAYPGPDGKRPAVMPQEKVKAEMYPGAQVRAQLSAFGYDQSGNRGVSFALNHLQKVGEGERLDGRTSAEDAFEADLSQAPADLAGLI